MKDSNCYNCVHYVHLYDDEQLHTLDDNTDSWYEPISVYGCSLLYDGFECNFKSRNYENNKQKVSEK